jgi:hypothetical protein
MYQVNVMFETSVDVAMFEALSMLQCYNLCLSYKMPALFVTEQSMALN